MKIIQLVQRSQLRGAELFASQLSTHLVALGHSVTLVAIFEGDASLPFAGEIVQMQRPSRMRLWDLAGWRQLAAMIKKAKPDLIQANAGDTLKFAVLSKLLFGWKTPVIFRNANKMSDFIDSRPKFWLNKLFLDRVTHIISVSKSCSNDLSDFFRIPTGKVDTIEIGIDLNPVGSLPADVAPIFMQSPVLVNVASMVPEKNQHGLLEIFAAIQKKYDNARLIIIGKGKLEAELKSYAKELGIESKVYFLGYRTDVLEIMQWCKAFLLPSHIEGLPGVILEAMYVNCPVVTYDVGGIGEVIRDGETGMLVAKNDLHGFDQRVTSLLCNNELMKRITEQAHHEVINRFDNRQIALRFIEVYRKHCPA